MTTNKQTSDMHFGRRVRELRKEKGLTLRDLSLRVGVGFTYLSKIENEKLKEGHQASAQLIHKLAVELGGDEDELLLLAEKVPEPIRRRVMERPDVFHAIAKLDDKRLDRIMKELAPKQRVESTR